MKLLLILLALAAYAGAPIGDDVTDTFKEKRSLTRVLQKYSDSFEKKNFRQLKTTVTDKFIKVTGGEQVWKERFKSLNGAKPKQSKIKNLKIILRNDNLYVSFDTHEKMPEGNWFLIKKVKGKFLLDEPINDFDPE